VSARKRTAAVVGVYNTRQGRRLEGETSRSLAVEAVRGALADAGIGLDAVDGITSGELSTTLIYDLRLGPAWQGFGFGLGMITEAAAAIENGMAEAVVLVAAQAGEYRDHQATAPWTRPENEFVASWGMFTAAEFALIARRHMHVYGTTREQLSIVAATIRNNGARNPEAVYYQRGPFVPDDITASRPIADPFHLLDCATTSEGGCALVVANVEKFDVPRPPIYVLGSGFDFYGPAYQHPPAWDLTGRSGSDPNGVVGRRAADLAFAHAGLDRDDVDVLELYDPFSFEIIRQLEAFRFCPDGQGGPFVADGHIAIDGSHPVTTDGGTMSFSHAGTNPQMMQRAIRAVQQLRGDAGPVHVPDAHIALCSNGGAGAMFTTVLLLGDQPR
jgi:acetyl-CoA acetyltransferase